MANELNWNKRTYCKFLATVDGVMISINESYAHSRAEIVSQLKEIYVQGSDINVVCVEWDLS